MAETLSVRVFGGFDQLRSLQTPWEHLFTAKPHEPSASFEWTLAMAAHHVRSGDACRVVQLWRGSRLVGVVPLVARTLRVMGQRVNLLTPLSEQYNTHSDLLLDDPGDEAVSVLVAALLALDVRWDCFRMARLLAENPLVPALCRALDRAGCAHAVRVGLPAYAVDLPDTFERYLAARSAKFRNHLRRVTRKLHEAGAVEVRHLDGDAAIDGAFAAMLAIEKASWKQEHGTAITAVDHQAGFYQDLATAAHGAGRLHLHWLTLDGRPVAYNLGYLTAAGYHYLKTSYAHDTRPLGPATYLRARLVESLIGARVGRLDFPGEPYQWETQWADTLRWRTVLSVYPKTLRGRALATIDSLRHRKAPAPQVEHVDPRAQRPGREHSA